MGRPEEINDQPEWDRLNTLALVKLKFNVTPEDMRDRDEHWRRLMGTATGIAGAIQWCSCGNATC